MAFTDEQKTQIRFFLGYPFSFQYLNPRLESAFALVGADVTATNIALALVKKLSLFYGIDPADPGGPAQIDKAVSQAGIEQVESADDVVKYGTTGSSSSSASSSAILSAQNDAARQMVGALSAMFGVEIASDVFSKNGYVSGGWAERSSWMSRGPRTFALSG